MSAILNVERIWDHGEHNAFCDLCVWNDTLIAVFREASAHVSVQGGIRVLQSVDAQSWHCVALLEHKDLDYRDPKLVVLDDGRLMLNMAIVERKAKPTVLKSAICFSSDALVWSQPTPVGKQWDWLWRATVLADGIYSVSYQKAIETCRLYKFDGQHGFDVVLDPLFSMEQNGLGYANEHAMCMLNDGRALCLLRRDADSGSAQLGSANPPYTQWSWKDLGVTIGGPELCRISDELILAAVRLYDPVRTSIAVLDEKQGQLNELFALPSGGDTSYAGLKQWRDKLYCVYYSSHEQHSSIYCAQLDLECIAQTQTAN